LSDLPLVSIVTPSLNQARFIESTISSVLTQDYPRIEYIVADGGSTDGTLEILRRHEGRLTWFSERDRGQSDAINKGFRKAHGHILAWLNSDDTYLPGAVSAAVRHLSRHPDCAMVYGEGYLIDEADRVKGRFPATEPFDLWKLVYVSDFILQQTTFFRRDTLEAVGYLDDTLNWAMDWDLFIRIGKRFRVDYLPQYMANLREYQAAKTASGGIPRLRELARVMRRHGSRRYPPGLFGTYGVDTLMRFVWDPLEAAIPAIARGPVKRARRLCEHMVYGTAERIMRNVKGLYADGWLAGRAHFLLRRYPGAKELLIRGRAPARFRSGLGISVRINGHFLGEKHILPDSEFEIKWELGNELHNEEVLEVDLRPCFTFRPSRVPFTGDRRALSLRLDVIEVR
jgi:glycosyltransferase involved in cell wall biosynthesis